MIVIAQGAKATGENWRDHWGTPDNIKVAVKKFYGKEPFDPCPWNPNFDGLTTSWSECAYINPPFSEYKKWVQHGLMQPPEQIWLSHTSHDVQWYKSLLSSVDAVCLLSKRVNFIHPLTGEASKSTAIGKCQTIFYRGVRVADFKESFSHLGVVFQL
jgi:hypothetical protein